MTVAELHRSVRELVAGAMVDAADRRDRAARDVAFGRAPSRDELAALCVTPEAAGDLSARITLWERRRDLWRLAAELPELEGQLAAEGRRVEARRRELEAQIAANRVTHTMLGRPFATVVADQDLDRRLRRELANTVLAPALRDRLRRAQAAFHQLVGLLPEGQRRAHEEREAALAQARERLRRALAVLAGLRERPLTERVKAKIDELAEHFRWRPHDAPALSGQAKDLEARLRDAPDEQAQSEREAQAEVDAARAELERLEAVPETWELLSAEFSPYDEPGQDDTPSEPAPRRKRTR